MTARYNVRGPLDMARLGAALSAPGIDQSTWTVLGRVDDSAESITWDPGVGWVADVTFTGGKLDQVGPVACKVMSPFAGQGQVASWPLAPGDCVLVALPGDGDPNDAPTIVGQVPTTFNGNVPLTINGATIDEAYAKATQFLVISGNVEAEVTGSWILGCTDIQLGGRDAEEPFVRGNDWRDAIESYASSIAQIIDRVNAAIPGGIPDPTASVDLTAANQALASAAAAYLSGTIRGK